MSASTTSGGGGKRPSLIGRTLDRRYRIVSALGEGGIGQVFVGEHKRLGRRVAIKVLHEQFQEKSNLRARFEREAQALATLSHPNIVTITDYGIYKDMPYIVMELVEGRDLMQVLMEGPLEPRRALRIMRQILRSLAYAHEQGIVHRDLKPANVLLRELPGHDDHVEVLDFGLAKFLDADDSAPSLTKTGVVVGTPAYMPPEQASGEVVDARADVYAAGLILFEMLSGERPFTISDRTERLKQQLKDKPPKLASLAHGAWVDPAVDAVIRKALALHLDRRYADGAEMLADVERLHENCVRWTDRRTTMVTAALERSWRFRPVRRVVLALAAIACMALGALLHAAYAKLTEPEQALPSAATAPVRAAVDDAAEPADADLAPPPFSDALSDYVARVDRGETLSRAQTARVRRHYRRNPDDSGAAVIMARSYFNRRYYGDAVSWYEKAFERDPRIRHHDGVLYELLQIVRTERNEAAASALIARMYGPAALLALDGELAEERQPEDRAALMRLRARLEEE